MSSQQWEPPDQQPRQGEQQPTTELPTSYGSTPYLPPYPDQFAVPAYQPYATHPPVPVSGTTTVLAAVIQLVQSAFWLVAGVVLAALSNDTSRFFDSGEFDQDFTPDVARTVIVGVATVIMLVAAAMLTLAILTLRRINGCRIASAVLQTVFGSFALIGLIDAATSGAPGPSILLRLLHCGSCAAAAVLLFLTASARYCRAGQPGVPRH